MNNQTKYVISNLDNCPLCGQLVVITLPDGTRFEITERVRPQALQAIDSDGYTLEARLRWECRRCGYTWRHEE